MALPNVSGEFLVIAEPTLRYGPSGTAILNLRCGAKSRKRQQDGSWTDDKKVAMGLVIFGKEAEALAGQVDKFTVLSVSNAQLQENVYTTQDGVQRRDVEMVANYGASVGILPPKEQGQNAPQNAPQGQQGGYGPPRGQQGYQQGNQGGQQWPQGAQNNQGQQFPADEPF